jgi:chromosomal replication initiation ATPase DnaA
MNVQQKRFAENVCKLTGTNVFEKTRKREVIEARSLLNWLYRKVCKMTYHSIARLYKKQGLNMDHATVIHSVKNYQMYEKYNRGLYEVRMLVMSSDRTATTEIRKEFISENIKIMDSDVVDDVYGIVYNNYK